MRRNTNLLLRYPILALAIGVIVTVSILNIAGQTEVSKWISIATVLFVSVLTAIDMIKSILRKIFGLDILALIAMVATLTVGEYLASLIIVLMLSGGEALEDYAELRASRELTSLLDRSPQTAHRMVDGVYTEHGENSYEIEDIKVDEVNVGDVLIVKPAEVIPVDGVLLSQEATFDEASITGESLPVTKTSGDDLLSGVLNGPNAVSFRATKLSSDSQFQQIVKLVEQTQNSQAPIVRVADRFAVPFTLVSLLIAGVAWALSGDALRFAQVLVLATPCPLLIAAPVAFLGGLSRAAKAGVIIKGGSVIERLARVESVAFDKTGTLTRGEPDLIEVITAPGFEENELLTLVASAEQYSSHVLADGIRRAALEKGLTLLSASSAVEQATNGVVAKISGRSVVVGKLSFIQSFAPEAEATDLKSGELAAYVAVDENYAGAVILSDVVRNDAESLITWLQNNKIEKIVMVTGDATQTANSVAAQLRINEVHSELLPKDKVRLIKQLRPQPSLMIGDGINDAPVLAAADVGIAMGARGSTAAGEAADAVILQDSILKVASAIDISRNTLKIALQAIWIGIIMSIGLMLVATTGVIPAVVGAFIQEIVDLVAILYALRTLSGQPLKINQKPTENLKNPIYQR